MKLTCPECHADVRTFVGHSCMAGKVSERSDEAKARDAGNKVEAFKRSPPRARSTGVESERTSSGKSRGDGESRPISSHEPGDALHDAGDKAYRPNPARLLAGVAPGPRAFRKPLAKDADKTLMATKPWEAEGMSRRTWYRRREKKHERINES